ncbi:MAG: PKD domain-containing protein [bacterium]|nr:PKD domain-containing protein [bacterium]
MRGFEKTTDILKVALVVALALVLGACDADSPTAPAQTPSGPITGATPTTGFSIQVSLDPRSVEAGSALPVTVTVVARRNDNNEFVPRGSTAALSTTSGTFTNLLTGALLGSSGAVTFGTGGTAQVGLTAPTQTAIVRAQIQESQGSATLTVTEAPTPVPFSVQALVPNFGPPTGGTEVRIEGSGFSLPIEVTFDGAPVQIIGNPTGSVIRVRTPAIELAVGSNRAVSVGVNINIGEEGQASDTLAGAYTYTRNESLLNPKIISITPASGPNEGGTPVTIFGEAFPSELQVFFGSTRIEATVQDISPTRILALTPSATGQNSANQNATVPVAVTDLNSGFTTTLANAFQYGGGDMFITAISPDEDVYLGGTLVNVFGTGGFEAPVTVAFGGEDQTVVSVSGTEIVARTVAVTAPNTLTDGGCGVQTGPTSVVNIETGETFGSGPTFTYRGIKARIDSLSPDSTTVDVDTGAIVFGAPTDTTISGAGFDRQGFEPEVTINGERASGVAITSLDPDPFFEGHGVGDLMDVDIPDFRGTFAEEACNVGTESGVRYLDTRVAVTVTARETGCSTTVTNAFTYIPDDTSCRIVPTAQFSFTVAGDTVTVTDISTGGPTSLTWDWADGAIENGTPGEMRMHTYTTSNTYNIKLTATNANGSGTTTRSVTVTVP